MNKTALVTGGSRGIGFGIAEGLASDGWDLVINGVRPAELASEALSRLRGRGVRVAYAQGDIGKSEGRLGILNACNEFTSGKTVNLLVNNAGVAPRVRTDLLETSEESYDHVVDTNLKGVFFLTQAVARLMVASKQKDPLFAATIVNITSISATVVSVNRGEYCISKAGLSMLSKLFAARLGEHGIPVYEVRPGVVRSDMTAGVAEKYDNLIKSGLFVQPRWGLPDDVGRAVASLARGDLAYSTGQVIMVDGGMTIPRL
jgi:NAD(P)-dependent dehydrogenase (short-subunit alcohol dehydrogenase family)